MWIYNKPMVNSFDEIIDDDMSAAKLVRTIGKGGAVLNHMSLTGDSHHHYACTLRAIHQFLTRGIRVYELLADGNELELTLDNYKKDNSGAEVPEGAQVVDNAEQHHLNDLDEIHTANLRKYGEEFKAEFEATYREAKNIDSIKLRQTSLQTYPTIEFYRIGLPMTGIATLEDETKIEIGISWDPNDYKAEIGEYTAIGTPVLDKYIKNEDEITVEMTISVVDPTQGNGIVAKAGQSPSPNPTPEGTTDSNDDGE